MSELHTAASHNDIEDIRALIIANRDIDAPSVHGLSPLMLAVQKKHREAVEVLLAAGVNLEATNPKNGNTALMYSVGNAGIMKLLLDAGSSVDVSDHIGLTTLMFASFVGDEKSVSLLLSRGADVLRIDRQGRNAVYWAMVWEHKAIADLLSTVMQKGEEN